MYIGWLIFSCNLVNVWPLKHFLSMGLNGIIDSTNGNGKSVSSLKMLFCTFTSAKIFPPTHQFFKAFRLNLITLFLILYIFDCQLSRSEVHIVRHFVVNPHHVYIFLSHLAFFVNVLIDLQHILLFYFGILFVPQDGVSHLIASNGSFPLYVSVSTS